MSDPFILLLQWQPTIPVRDGVAQLIRWVRDNKDLFKWLRWKAWQYGRMAIASDIQSMRSVRDLSVRYKQTVIGRCGL